MEQQPTPETSDPRLGYTSASNAEADSLCPGRHIAQRGLAGYETRESAAGTAAHAVFAGTMDISELSPSQARTVKRAREIEEHIVERWFVSINERLDEDRIEQEIQKRAKREHRLWAYHRGQRIHSGAIDAFWLSSDMKHALVEDLKSLFGDVEDAPENQQLRDYAALMRLNYGCESVTVLINQPNVRWNLTDQLGVRYDENDLDQAVEEMRLRVIASNHLDSPRRPGLRQCRYCLAAGTSRCPESLKEIRQFEHGFDHTWEFWSPERRGEMIEKARLAIHLAETVGDIAKSELKKDPDWAAGWQVLKDTFYRNIAPERTGEVIGVLTEAFAADDPSVQVKILRAIQKISRLSISDLEAVHEQFSSQPTAADRRDEFNLLLGHMITTAERSGSLKRKK